MKLPPFKLEDYFARWEFEAPYLLCTADPESWKLSEILELADREALSLWQNLSLGYTDTRGLLILREEIATLYPGLDAKNILCFSGAEEGIFCLLQALLKPTDHAIVITPCYQSLEVIPRETGAAITTLALQEFMDWSFELEALEAAIQPNTKAIIFNTPHNPTGALMSHEQYQKLIELARARGLYLFCDEVYRFLELEESDRLPTMASSYEKGISLGVMSKAFGLAGLRVGWVATQDRGLLERAAALKQYTSICCAAPSEVLALIGLRGKEHLLSVVHKTMHENMIELDRFFGEHHHLFSWVRPKGSCVAFPRLLTGESTEVFCQRLLKSQGVLLLPGKVFDGYDHHFRLGFGRVNMGEALSRLESFVKTNLAGLG